MALKPKRPPTKRYKIITWRVQCAAPHSCDKMLQYPIDLGNPGYTRVAEGRLRRDMRSRIRNKLHEGHKPKITTIVEYFAYMPNAKPKSEKEGGGPDATN